MIEMLHDYNVCGNVGTTMHIHTYEYCHNCGCVRATSYAIFIGGSMLLGSSGYSAWRDESVGSTITIHRTENHHFGAGGGPGITPHDSAYFGAFP